jgi:MFS family permease
MSDLRIVMFVGLGIEIFNSCLMLLYDDKKALEEVGDENSDNDDDDSDDDSSDTGNIADEETVELTTLQRRQEWIPYIIFAQDLIAAFGSGMTIKFFPLFFKDEIGMTPSQVQVIFCIAPLVMAMTSTLGSKLASSGFGRVQTQLLFSMLGVSCLYGMVFFQHFLSLRPLWLVPIYVARTSLMNGSYPLQESILMDFVPKHSRGRWKSLDSVASFGWCGSAALGGWLADKYDYTYTFLITAILQSVAIGVWALLLPLVPRTEGMTNHPPNSSTSATQEPMVEEIIPRCDSTATPIVDGEEPLPQELLGQPLLSVE